MADEMSKRARAARRHGKAQRRREKLADLQAELEMSRAKRREKQEQIRAGLRALKRRLSRTR